MLRIVRTKVISIGVGVIAASMAITLFLSRQQNRTHGQRGAISSSKASLISPTAATAPLRTNGSTVVPPEPISFDPRLAPARGLLDKGEYAMALRATESAKKQGAPPAEILATQAEVFRGTHYLDKEMEALRRWSAISPKDLRPILRLYYIYFDLGWRHEASLASDRILKTAPKDARSLEARAILHYHSNEAYRGLKYIEEARHLDPGNPSLANLHATILIKSHRAPEAEAVLRDLIAQKRGRATDRLLYVQALLVQHKTQDMETVLRQLLSEEPDNMDVQYQLGAFEEKRGHHEEAARYFEQVAKRNPQYAKTLWFLGRIYMQQGRTDEGRKLLKQFQDMDANYKDFVTTMLRLESWPNDPNLHYRLAQFRLASEDELPQAIVELRRVLELRPSDQRARKDLATALARHGRLTESRKIAVAPTFRSHAL